MWRQMCVLIWPKVKAVAGVIVTTTNAPELTPLDRRSDVRFYGEHE